MITFSPLSISQPSNDPLMDSWLVGCHSPLIVIITSLIHHKEHRQPRLDKFIVYHKMNLYNFKNTWMMAKSFSQHSKLCLNPIYGKSAMVPFGCVNIESHSLSRLTRKKKKLLIFDS
jgi:hypothetical protein